MLGKKINAVAIDGPAGSGKSTVSRLVAEKLGYTYIDTGATYRALTLKAMRNNIDLSDEGKIIDLSSDISIELAASDKDGRTINVLMDGRDISEEIRRMEVTVNVKHVCRIAGVRENMVSLQRRMAAESSGAVMEGRDIGTVVLPGAKYKFYVDADFHERVERRLAEMRAKGNPVNREEIEDDLRQRDHTDRTREVGPLRKAEDAFFIDTTGLTIEQVVDKIISVVRENKR